MRKEYILLLITVVFSVFCCGWFIRLTMDARERASILDESAEIRTAKARKNHSGDITVGVAYDGSSLQTMAVRTALEMAAADINNSDILKGRRIKLIYQDDKRDVNEARFVAQSFVNNSDINVVIGHPSSTSATKVQPIYEFYGVLFFTPAASNPKLSRNGAKLFFRNYPDDKVMGQAIAELCQKNNFKRIVILYSDIVYGREISNAIESVADLLHIEVIGRYPFSLSNPDFSRIIEEWQRFQKPDAVVAVFDYPESGRKFLDVVKDIKLDTPLIFTPDMAELPLPRLVSGYDSNVYIMDIRPDENVDGESPKMQSFMQRFTEKTGEEPNFLACNSYEALDIIAEAIARCGSTAAEDIAREIHTVKKFTGISGELEFEDNGDVIREIRVDRLAGGSLSYADDKEHNLKDDKEHQSSEKLPE